MRQRVIYQSYLAKWLFWFYQFSHLFKMADGQHKESILFVFILISCPTTSTHKRSIQWGGGGGMKIFIIYLSIFNYYQFILTWYRMVSRVDHLSHVIFFFETQVQEKHECSGLKNSITWYCGSEGRQTGNAVRLPVFFVPATVRIVLKYLF